MTHDDKCKNLFRFLEKSYKETITLLIFSRDYFENKGRIDKLQLSREDSIAYTLAMSTVTTQLTSVLGWLLMCKAVEQGELTLEDIRRDEFRMAEFEAEYSHNDSIYATLNETVHQLLQKSSLLHSRIKRMENSIMSDLEKNIT